MSANLPTELDLASEFASIARSLSVPDEPDATFGLVAETAVAVIDGCEHCAITVTKRGRPYTVGATGDVPVAVDQIQYDVGEGPCFEAIRSSHIYEMANLADEPRWPRFAKRVVAETPVRSAISYRLFLHNQTLGALNLYATKPGCFAIHDREVGTIFAAHAAVALAAVNEVEQLRAALHNRDVISMAKGILMARQEIDEDAAFDILRRASQRTNVKLRDLAERLIRPIDRLKAGSEPPDADTDEVVSA